MIDLTASQLDEVRAILVRHAPDCVVWAFGSRVTGKAKPYSDLDLAIRSRDGLLGFERLAMLREAFAESTLPIRVDVVDWHSLPPSIQGIITQRHESLVPLIAPADFR